MKYFLSMISIFCFAFTLSVSTLQAATLAPGEYQGVHKNWTDNVNIQANGTCKRGNGDQGTWTFNGKVLAIKWKKGGADTLVLKPSGIFSAMGYKFTLTPLAPKPAPAPAVVVVPTPAPAPKPAPVVVPTPKPAPAVVVVPAPAPVIAPAPAAAFTPGTYQAVHRHWSDNVIFAADGTFHRAAIADRGTWTFDGKTLVLKWQNWDAEYLVMTAPGNFSCSSYQFTLAASGQVNNQLPTPASLPATKIEGLWRGTAQQNGAETVDIKKVGTNYTFTLNNLRGKDNGIHNCIISEATADGKTGTIRFTSGSLSGATLRYTITGDNDMSLSWGTSYTRQK